MKVPASLLQRSCTYKPYWLTDIVPRTALAVLWLAMHRFDVDSMVALTLAEAAGVSGRQNWSLILSSSARVSRVTYEAVIAVRYPELDHTLAQEVQFGTYLAEGFFPSFGFPPMIPFVRPLILGQRLIGSLGNLNWRRAKTGAWLCFIIVMTWLVPSMDPSGSPVQRVELSPEGLPHVQE